VAKGIPIPSLPDISSGNLAIPAGVDFSFQGASLPKDFIRGYTESWNLTIQKDFGHNWVGQVGYVGTHTVHQHTRYDINFPQVGGGAASRPFASRGITGIFAQILPFGSMKYNALQATLSRRFSNGFNLEAAYTFSKWNGLCCDDNASTDLLNLDREVGDYVIVHELLHFSVPNHGKLWRYFGHSFQDTL
jgi:Protein of unknown function DUF45